MSKLILVTLLAITCGNAMAEWVKVGTNGNLTTYVSLPLPEKSDNIVKMWVLVDLKNPGKEEAGKSFLSAKSLRENDCQTSKLRQLMISFFSENMGAGEVIHAYMNPEWLKWIPVAPQPLNKLLWEMACEKK